MSLSLFNAATSLSNLITYKVLNLFFFVISFPFFLLDDDIYESYPYGSLGSNSSWPSFSSSGTASSSSKMTSSGISPATYMTVWSFASSTAAYRVSSSKLSGSTKSESCIKVAVSSSSSSSAKKVSVPASWKPVKWVCPRPGTGSFGYHLDEFG